MDGFNLVTKTILDVRNKFLRDAQRVWLKYSIHNLISRVVDRIKGMGNVIKKIKEIWAAEIVVALSFLILAEKNIEQRGMSTDDNEQEQTWRNERDTRATRNVKATEEWSDSN